MLRRVQAVTFEMCMFGMPHRKSTTLMTSCSALAQLARRCNHRSYAVTLIGTSGGKTEVPTILAPFGTGIDLQVPPA